MGGGRMIELGAATRGYLATPASAGTRCPGVIVLPEWWGLVPHIEDVCDRFASEGFVALAPDLYHGKSTGSPDEAEKLMMALDLDRAEQDLRGAVTRLLQEPAVTTKRVGVVGFCMGGQLALYAATTIPEIGACVDFYGIHERVKPDWSRLRAPVLGLFAERDRSVPPATAHALERELRALGKSIEVKIYPGVRHAFFNDQRPQVHDPAAASDAWRRVLEFLRAHLA